MLAQARTYEFTENGPDVKIPLQIWEKFGAIGSKDTVSFVPIALRLKEKTSGVLTDPEIEIKFPRGGGQIDLAQFVKDQQGTFLVSFQFETATEKEKTLVYFVSRARKRKLDSEVWGAGCNRFMNLQDYFNSHQAKDGFEVNTTRNRHLSVIGGTFFFAQGPQISQVTFFDSRYPQLFCDSKQTD